MQIPFFENHEQGHSPREWRSRPRVRGARPHGTTPGRFSGTSSLAHNWVQLGHASKESGELRFSESCYLAAIELEPRQADTYLQLGHPLKLTGRSAQAQVAYTQALRLDAGCSDAVAELAQLRAASA